MRNSLFFALRVIFLISFPLISSFGGSEVTKNDNSFQHTNYVVIGAFSVQKNAVSFTERAVKNSFGAKFEKNFNRNLFYVYVMITDSHEAAIAEAIRLRSESPYFDTWVYNGVLGKEGKDVIGTDINPATEQQIKNIESNEENTEASIVPVAKSEPTVQETPRLEEDPDDEIVGKKFFFKIFRGDNAEQVEGDIDVIDAEKARKIGTYVGNKKVKITRPPGKSGNILLVCQIFGFRKIQRDINYNTPEGEDIQLNEDSAAVVPFELTRLQKGDHAIMYNVYFFNDAAIMRPESRYEVGSLLAMLQENPKYKIRIHGHTNGNYNGKIISLADGNKDYFALNNTVNGTGSAKKLSGDRAQLIKTFLVDGGIEESRMEVKAWGGKKAIYDKHSQQAQSNVRVEIEILDN